MAKKTGTVGIDESVYVKQLVSAGMTSSEAEAGVAKLVRLVNEKMAGESDETKSNTISIKIRDMISATKAEKYRAIIVAVGGRYDANGRSRNKAVDTYNDDPDRAVSSGMVKIVRAGTINAVQAKDGKWLVAYDTKEFWDEAGTKKNFGFGKPFPIKMTKNIIAIVEGKLGSMNGDLNVEAGHSYDIFGKISEATGVLYANTEPAPRLVSTLGAGEFWSQVAVAAKDSDMATDVNGVLEEDIKGIVLVKGFVHASGPTSTGGMRVVLNNEVGSGITAFAVGPKAEESMKNVSVGSEAILVGTVRDAKDPQYGKQMRCYQAIVNPKGGSISKTLEDLKDFEF